MPDYRNLNYVGSSGWGVLPGGRYGRLTTTPSQRPTGADHAVYDASSGRVVSYNTGQPFHGIDPGTGRNFVAGVETPVAPAINPNSPERYQPIERVRSPATAQAESDLMETFRRNAASALPDFGTALNQFRTDVTGARTAATQATNVAPTIGALTTAEGRYETGLDTATQRYEQALADAAARERGVVTQATDLLPAYDTALNNILANQLGLVRGNVSRYKMGTGTPRSLGSAESQILARGALEASLPIEQARINRRYDILTGMALPTEERIAGRDIGYAGSYLPQTAGSRYSAATGLATTTQSLLERAAASGLSNAAAFIQMYGIPAQLQQQILNGEITELQALNQIEEASRYRGLQDLVGVNVTQPVGYNMSLPAYPNYPARYPTTSTGTTGANRYAGVNAPITVTPTAGGIQYRPITGAPGGTPFDYASYYTSLSPSFVGPTRYPTTYAHSTPNVYTGIPDEYRAGGVGG